MIDGKLTIKRADNGWTLQWWEREAGTPVPRCEVFDNADTFLTRVGILTESLMANEFIETFHYRDDPSQADLDAHVEPGSPDALVAELTAPGTPPTARGDE